MKLDILLMRQGLFFLLSGCLFLSGCNKSHISESTSLIDKKVYLNHQYDRQYPPNKVLTKIDHQAGNKKKDNVNEIKKSDKKFHLFTLKNGLKVNYLARDNSPYINIMAIVKAGKDQLNVKEELLSPLVLKLLRQGTQEYSKPDFQDAVSLLGEPIRYWQTSQYSVISMNILPQDMELALTLLAQQLAYVEADNNACKKIVEQQLIENKLLHSSGSYLAKLLFYQNNYPQEHVYYQYAPNSRLIKHLNKAEILDFYQTYYKASQSQLIISGDIDVNEMHNQIVRNFSQWDRQNKYLSDGVPATFSNSTSFSTNKGLRFDLIQRKGAQQIDLLYGVVTVPRRSSDWLSLNIIAVLLGGGPSSRLFSDLREQQGLAYFISARQLSGRYQSPFFIQTSIAPDKLIQMVNGINNHIEYLCQNEIKQQELAHIKQQLRGEILFKLQTNQQLVNNKRYQLENGLDNDYLYQLSEDIRQINAPQLLKAANEYLCGQHNFIAVGDLSSIDKTIEKKLKDYDFRTHHLPLN